MPIRKIDEIIEEGIAAHKFPGAVCVVEKEGTIVHERAYGTTMYDDPGSHPVRLDTIYDIASITKVFTATAIFRLIEAGRLALDDPLRKFFHEFEMPTKQYITIADLLSHRAGIDISASGLRDLSPGKIRHRMLTAEPDYRHHGWLW